MNLLGRDYERIAMCSHPQGTHEHVPLKSGEDPPETCFADCDCVPVVFVRADLHRGAVEALERIAAISVDERRLNIPHRARLNNAVAIATGALADLRGQ